MVKRKPTKISDIVRLSFAIIPSAWNGLTWKAMKANKGDCRSRKFKLCQRIPVLVYCDRFASPFGTRMGKILEDVENTSLTIRVSIRTTKAATSAGRTSA